MSTSRPVTLQEARATLRLAGPVVTTMLAQISMGFVDTVMVGRLGPGALAGVALGNTLYVFCFVVCLGFITAVGPMVAQAYGAGEWAPIGRSVRQGMWLAVLLSVPAWLVLWNLEGVLLAAGQAPEVVDRAVGYLRAVLWGLPLALCFIALRNFVEALSRPALVTAITAVGVLVNVGANYVLMFGKLGFPALGLVGTGWATSIVNVFLFLGLARHAAIRFPRMPEVIPDMIWEPPFSDPPAASWAGTLTSRDWYTASNLRWRLFARHLLVNACFFDFYGIIYIKEMLPTQSQQIIVARRGGRLWMSSDSLTRAESCGSW